MCFSHLRLRQLPPLPQKYFKHLPLDRRGVVRGEKCAVLWCGVVGLLVEGCWLRGGPLPFGHTAVSVLRRITVTLSFLLPHFRRTHTHTDSALVSLAVRVTDTHTQTHTYTQTATQTEPYLAYGKLRPLRPFSFSLLWPNLAGAVRTTMSSPSPSPPPY